MSGFRTRSQSFSQKESVTVNLLDDKQYIVKVLQNKLKTAESKMKDIVQSIEKSAQQDKILQELNQRLMVTSTSFFFFFKSNVTKIWNYRMQKKN